MVFVFAIASIMMTSSIAINKFITSSVANAGAPSYTLICNSSSSFKTMANVKAYLQITMNIKEIDCEKATKEYFDYRQPFLDTIEGALTMGVALKHYSVICRI